MCIRDSDYLALFFETFSENGFRREEIIFNEIFKKIGNQEIRNDYEDLDGFVGTLYSRTESDGDVYTRSYILDESYDKNAFFISFADSTKISGKFSVRFILEEDDFRYPKFAEFEDVNFSMQILNEPPE